VVRFIPSDEIAIEDDPNPEFRYGDKLECPYPSCDREHHAVVLGTRDDGETIIVRYSDRGFDELLFLNAVLRKIQ